MASTVGGLCVARIESARRDCLKSSSEKAGVQKLNAMLYFSIYTAEHAFGQMYRKYLDGIGLTCPQYLVMVALWTSDGLRVKDIGDALFLDSGTVTPLLKRLEKAGFITRARSVNDQRQVLIHLTPSGDALKQHAAAISISIEQALGLDAPTARKVRSAVTDLRDRIYRVV